MSKPKFCVDCKHYRRIEIQKPFEVVEYQHKCAYHKQAIDKFDLVTGDAIYLAGDAILYDCITMRAGSYNCATDARFFEVK